jgi:hypothetical protein
MTCRLSLFAASSSKGEAECAPWPGDRIESRSVAARPIERVAHGYERSIASPVPRRVLPVDQPRDEVDSMCSSSSCILGALTVVTP